MKRVLPAILFATLLIAGPVLAGQLNEPGPADISVSDVEINPDGICRATANCWNGSVVMCSGISSASTCFAVNSSCPTQRGYVKCDGVYTWCPACPPEVCSKEWWPCSIDDDCRPPGEAACQYCSCESIWDRPIGECLCL